METINQATSEVSVASNKVLSVNIFSWFDRQAGYIEKARFGWMAILITIQSCLGSIAAAYILKNDASVFILSTCAAVSMGCNAMFISLAPPKVCLIGFYLSVLLNALFILMNI